MQNRINPVFRSLNTPLTLLGAERKLFFCALVMGAAVFNLLHTFLGGILMFRCFTGLPVGQPRPTRKSCA
jgi:type IV secretory pathway TrbD component